jgi:hypothetical protein
VITKAMGIQRVVRAYLAQKLVKQKREESSLDPQVSVCLLLKGSVYNARSSTRRGTALSVLFSLCRLLFIVHVFTFYCTVLAFTTAFYYLSISTLF